MLACGLDFGTSNSSIGILKDGVPCLVPLEGEAGLMPSAVFIGEEQGERVLFGSEAIATHIAQENGRLMRALKTLLGSSLIEERTLIGARKVALKRIIELFVRHLKSKAEAFAGGEIDAVVHGRPVYFADGDPVAERRAESVLEEIAAKAGFKEIEFVYEPIAAAYHYEESVDREDVVLVADIGGGTSDFSVIRLGPERRIRRNRASDVLASTGARIGGTDFDAALSLAAVMPLLGLGSHQRRKNLPMPRALFHDLATWAMINFVYSHKTERLVRDLYNDAQEPEKLARLWKCVRSRLGHRLAFSVEDAKIALSVAEHADAALGFLEPLLAAPMSRSGFDGAIADKAEKLRASAAACIAQAGLRAPQIGAIFFTGGSSRVPLVRKAVGAAAPCARIATGSDLLSVALGLAREAGHRFAPLP